MTNVKQISVGYDASPESVAATQWAAHEALLRGCRLRLAACYRLPVAGDFVMGWPSAEAYSIVMEATEKSVASAVEDLYARFPDLDVVTEVLAESPVIALDGVDDELVVLGASSHHGAAAFWLGSTPRGVVRRAHCPVVVVRGEAARPRRVVVGVDGSAASDDAVGWAAAEADRHRVPLHVVHTWCYPYNPIDPERPGVDYSSNHAVANDLTRVDAATVLDAGVELARELCGSDVTAELVEGSTPSALLSVVGDGDLLVVGSRGRGALRAGVFGSTANAVLDRATTTVVVVRDSDEQE